MEGSAADSQRVCQALIRAGTKAVNRNGEAFYAEFCHLIAFLLGCSGKRVRGRQTGIRPSGGRDRVPGCISPWPLFAWTYVD